MAYPQQRTAAGGYGGGMLGGTSGFSMNTQNGPATRPQANSQTRTGAMGGMTMPMGRPRSLPQYSGGVETLSMPQISGVTPNEVPGGTVVDPPGLPGDTGYQPPTLGSTAYSTNGNFGKEYKLNPNTAQKQGLGGAASIIEQSMGREQFYPDDYTSQMLGPAQMDYFQNTRGPGYEKVGGLMGGDYARLEQALSAPVLQQAQEANQQIKDIYGGRGLYGSVGNDLMSGAMSDAQQATNIGLSNAVANRYGLEMQDRAQRMNENETAWKSGFADAEQQNQYNQNRLAWDYAQQQAGNDFYNQQLAQQSQYQKDRNTWQNQIDEMNFQRMLQLGGLGNSGASVAAQIDAANANRSAAENAGMWQGIGGLAGGLLSSGTGGGNTIGGDIFGGIGDWVGGLFD